MTVENMTDEERRELLKSFWNRDLLKSQISIINLIWGYLHNTRDVDKTLEYIKCTVERLERTERPHKY